MDVQLESAKSHIYEYLESIFLICRKRTTPSDTG